jgi:succinate dehydrogenase / fumarate reductase membrane anchor subunit
MVKSVTNFGRNGLSDWLVQRVSAVVIALYVIYLFGFFLCHPHVDYATWRALFAHPVMKISTMLVLLCVCAHAWIGLWTVFTDYVKCACLRVVLEVLLILLLLTYVIWGISLLWR